MVKGLDTSKVNRVELIDHTKSFEEGGGRTVVFWDLRKRVDIDIQDDGRTMKIFVETRPALNEKDQD